MGMMALDQPVPAAEACAKGAVQLVADVFDPAVLANAPNGAALLLCRYLLHDAVWTQSVTDLQHKLLVWQTEVKGGLPNGETPVTAEQLEQLAEVRPRSVPPIPETVISRPEICASAPSLATENGLLPCLRVPSSVSCYSHPKFLCTRRPPSPCVCSVLSRPVHPPNRRMAMEALVVQGPPR